MDNQPDLAQSEQKSTEIQTAGLSETLLSTIEPTVPGIITSQPVVENPDVVKPTPIRATIAFVLVLISLLVSGFVLYSYLASFTSMAESDLPEIGLVQGVFLLFLAVPAAIAAVLAITARSLLIKLDESFRARKFAASFAIWLSFAFFAIHTFSLWLYATIAAISFTIGFLRRSKKFESKRRKVMAVALVVLIEAVVAIGVVVALRMMEVTQPLVQLLFFL